MCVGGMNGMVVWCVTSARAGTKDDNTDGRRAWSRCLMCLFGCFLFCFERNTAGGQMVIG